MLVEVMGQMSTHVLASEIGMHGLQNILPSTQLIDGGEVLSAKVLPRERAFWTNAFGSRRRGKGHLDVSQRREAGDQKIRCTHAVETGTK